MVVEGGEAGGGVGERCKTRRSQRRSPIDRKAPLPPNCCLPAGNKADMEKSRNVDKEEALRYTASVGGSHHLTSAKSGAGISEAFTDLLKRVVAKKKQAAKQAAAAADRQPSRSTLKVVEDEPGSGSAGGKGGCCG